MPAATEAPPSLPNLPDYERARADFAWPAAWAMLDGLPTGGLNIAHEAVDRHANGPRAERVAIRWLGKKGATRDLTYAALKAQSSRFAHVLADHGVREGDRVFSLTGRIPELYVAALGTLRHRAVFCPMFSAFGPEPLRIRMTLGDAAVLVTTAALYRKKVAPIRDQLPALKHVFVVGDTAPEGTLALGPLLAAASDQHVIEPTDPQQMALLHFTSGTTGTPKGAVHVHEAVVMHHLTGRWALDLRDDDIYWCTADPGWVTGTSYGIVAPLTCGVTMIVDEAEFDAARWYRILDEQGVTVWYTAPTALRMLMRAGEELPRAQDLSRLRVIASVGEPLNPEVVRWTERVYGRPALDNWWQTETGGIAVSNFPSVPVRHGSMGRPMPGIEAAVVHRDGDRVVPVEAGAEGELALRSGWPSMFRGYLHERERYERCFADGWYLTGDLARQDADGYLWFVGRADDVIKSAGHLVGPFEVESALVEHPAVAEAAVIGVPDEVAGEVVKAFVLLAEGQTASDELADEIVGFARSRLGAAVAPRSVAFVEGLPRTRSGKILRRLLKARELGLPEGDLSTLEAP